MRAQHFARTKLALVGPVSYPMGDAHTARFAVEETMDNEADRRAAGAARIAFEALVEVGGASGPSFEARSTDVSRDGMHLRGSFLPEIGQPLTCRFEAGQETVLASGDVAWRRESEQEGEFGVRFTSVDAESAEVLERILRVAANPAVQPGARVRLHIDGVASPIRARVRDTTENGLNVGTELSYLKVGKDLELEDAATGNRHSARLDGVTLEIDRASQIPQLVVSLRTGAGDVAAAKAGATVVDAPKSETPSSDVADGAIDGVKAAWAKFATIGPAAAGMASRAKSAMALLWAKRRGEKSDDGAGARRTTAPPPGGIYSSKGKVLRGQSTMDDIDTHTDEKKFRIDRRKAAVAGAIGVAVILGAIALRKPAPPPAATVDPAADTAVTATTPGAAATPLALSSSTPAAPMAAANATPPPAMAPAPVVPSPIAVANAEPPATEAPSHADKKGAKAKKSSVPPFGNGPVAHGNVIRLKMDGAIDKIQGAHQPNGFTVVVPSRRSLEAAGPLAARDGRIASMHVTNEGAGAELSVSFKDGVPNYQVRAHGDTLEIALAPAGTVASTKPAHGDKHPTAKAKHDKKKHDGSTPAHPPKHHH